MKMKTYMSKRVGSNQVVHTEICLTLVAYFRKKGLNSVTSASTQKLERVNKMQFKQQKRISKDESRNQ